jgi:hypothetical protein
MSSSLEARAQEIAKNEKIGYVRARIRAAHEAFGVSNVGNEPSQADIAKAVTSGEIVMFGRLIEIASHTKVAPEIAILAAKVYLAESKRQADSGALSFIDPDPDV